MSISTEKMDKAEAAIFRELSEKIDMSQLEDLYRSGVDIEKIPEKMKSPLLVGSIDFLLQFLDC